MGLKVAFDRLFRLQIRGCWGRPPPRRWPQITEPSDQSWLRRPGFAFANSTSRATVGLDRRGHPIVHSVSDDCGSPHAGSVFATKPGLFPGVPGRSRRQKPQAPRKPENSSRNRKSGSKYPFADRARPGLSGAAATCHESPAGRRGSLFWGLFFVTFSGPSVGVGWPGGPPGAGYLRTYLGPPGHRRRFPEEAPRGPPQFSARRREADLKMSTTTSSGGNDRQGEAVEKVVIRFAGDSGDGMQLTGTQFTQTAALIGNDLSTFPDFPAEIRAPAGLPGVPVPGPLLVHGNHTPGDSPDVLVA